MATEPNDAAMPLSYEYESREGTERDTEYGLTKREYFAAMAMQALITGTWACPLDAQGPIAPERNAKMAIEYADALINQLDK